jgi:hypothetical protein
MAMTNVTALTGMYGNHHADVCGRLSAQYFHFSVSRNNIGGCNCQSYYEWNPSSKECELACYQVRGSTGKAISKRECECEPGTVWIHHKFIVAPFKKKSFQYHAQERRHKSFELTSSATKYVDSKI